MHPRFTQASEIAHDVIGAAIDVHKGKDPGLLELIIHFHILKLTDGVSRLILPGANHQ